MRRIGQKHSTDTVDRETTANQLYSHLFEACNILRGPIDQDDYKSYVIPILFFKRLSDVYDEETADNELKYGDDIVFYPEDELHAFVIPKGCHWKDVRETSEDVGKAIVDAMMGIEHANPDTLAGIVLLLRRRQLDRQNQAGRRAAEGSGRAYVLPPRWQPKLLRRRDGRRL
jgi:Type I restriction-modification system methyltransferase subunit